MKPDFLLEIFCEEIPARMQEEAACQLSSLAHHYMTKEDLVASSIQTYVTPRRLTLILKEVLYAPQEQEKKGPPVSEDSRAVQAFCRSLGITLEQCYQQDLPKGGRVWMARYTPHNGGITEQLQHLCQYILQEFSWPKRMRWGEGSFTWVRPIRHLVCLYGTQVLPWTWQGLIADRLTEGHRNAMAWGADSRLVSITSPATYTQQLRAHFVLADRQERLQKIAHEVRVLAQQSHSIPFEEDLGPTGLIQEVAGLTEWPMGILGQFESCFLQLPVPLITTTLKDHQRYFPLKSSQTHQLSRDFVVITNTHRPSEEMRQGYERVVNARLSDALFYWELDRKKPLASYNEALKARSFFQGLGSLQDKVQRLERLAALIGAREGLAAGLPHLIQAAHLSKADLATGLVAEFPHLQGTMGRYYAQDQGIAPEVARMIEESYWPQGEGDLLGQSRGGGILGIIDRIDTLVGFFALKRFPSGSKDPMGLRRAAYGMIRLLVHHQCVSSVRQLSEEALEAYHQQGLLLTIAEVPTELEAFCQERLHFLCQEQVLDIAYLEAAWANQPLYQRLAQAYRLRHLFSDERGQAFLTAYRRAYALVQQHPMEGDVQEDRLLTGEERALWQLVQHPCLDPEGFLQQCLRWAEALHAFFDRLRVVDPEFGANRLALLRRILQVFMPLGNLPALWGGAK